MEIQGPDQGAAAAAGARVLVIDDSNTIRRSAEIFLRQGGHEVLLQLPMEPFDYPDNDPGPQTLLTMLSADQNADRLAWHRFAGDHAFIEGRFV